MNVRIPHRTRAPSARRWTMRITLRLVEIKRLSGRANRRDPRFVMTIVYAGEELITGDEIAQALLKYSEALAEKGSASTVEIPILSDDGTRSTATVLVGPASQIVARPAESSFGELHDPRVVEHLAALTTDLRPGPSVPSPMSSDVPDWVEDL